MIEKRDEVLDVKLSNEVKIKDYLEMEKNKERKKIAEFVERRFMERYINPLKKVDKRFKSGFAIIALSCLMIEALESFRNGRENTKGKSKEAFRNFFQFAKENNLKLGVFSEVADDFYDNVRCSLLHQAETVKGWRILRKGALFNRELKTINANEFLKGVEEALEFYTNMLRNSKWDDEIWVNLRKKMNAIIRNCNKEGENHGR